MSLNSTFDDEKSSLTIFNSNFELEELQRMVVIVTTGMSFVAMWTLLIPVIIAPGLQGHTSASAQTLMWVQALAEIAKRGVLVFRGVCVTFG